MNSWFEPVSSAMPSKNVAKSASLLLAGFSSGCFATGARGARIGTSSAIRRSRLLVTRPFVSQIVYLLTWVNQ